MSEPSEDNELYTIEMILAERFINNGVNVQYLVKWENYPPEQCTWEPTSSFTDSREVLAEWRARKMSGNALGIEELQAMEAAMANFQQRQQETVSCSNVDDQGSEDSGDMPLMIVRSAKRRRMDSLVSTEKEAVRSRKRQFWSIDSLSSRDSSKIRNPIKEQYAVQDTGKKTHQSISRSLPVAPPTTVRRQFHGPEIRSKTSKPDSGLSHPRTGSEPKLAKNWSHANNTRKKAIMDSHKIGVERPMQPPNSRNVASTAAETLEINTGVRTRAIDNGPAKDVRPDPFLGRPSLRAISGQSLCQKSEIAESPETSGDLFFDESSQVSNRITTPPLNNNIVTMEAAVEYFPKRMKSPGQRISPVRKSLFGGKMPRDQSSKSKIASPTYQHINPDVCSSKAAVPRSKIPTGPIFQSIGNMHADVLNHREPRKTWKQSTVLNRSWLADDLVVDIDGLPEPSVSVKLAHWPWTVRQSIQSSTPATALKICLEFSLITRGMYENQVRNFNYRALAVVEPFVDTEAALDRLSRSLEDRDSAAVWTHPDPEKDLSLLLYSTEAESWRDLGTKRVNFGTVRLQVAAAPRFQFIHAFSAASGGDIVHPARMHSVQPGSEDVGMSDTPGEKIKQLANDTPVERMSLPTDLASKADLQAAVSISGRKPATNYDLRPWLKDLRPLTPLPSDISDGTKKNEDCSLDAKIDRTDLVWLASNRADPSPMEDAYEWCTIAKQLPAASVFKHQSEEWGRSLKLLKNAETRMHVLFDRDFKIHEFNSFAKCLSDNLIHCWQIDYDTFSGSNPYEILKAVLEPIFTGGVALCVSEPVVVRDARGCLHVLTWFSNQLTSNHFTHALILPPGVQARVRKEAQTCSEPEDRKIFIKLITLFDEFHARWIRQEIDLKGIDDPLIRKVRQKFILEQPSKEELYSGIRTESLSEYDQSKIPKQKETKQGEWFSTWAATRIGDYRRFIGIVRGGKINHACHIRWETTQQFYEANVSKRNTTQKQTGDAKQPVVTTSVAPAT